MRVCVEQGNEGTEQHGNIGTNGSALREELFLCMCVSLTNNKRSNEREREREREYVVNKE